MTKVIRLTACVIVAAFAMNAFAQAESPQIRREIEAVYLKWDMLMAKKDFNGLMSMMDPSFVHTDKNGHVMYFPEVKRQMQGMMSQMRDCKSKITINEIQSQGNEVVAWVTAKMSYKQRRGNAWVPMVSTMRLSETLRRVNGQWKFVATQEWPPS